VLVAPVVAPIWKHTGKTKQETFKWSDPKKKKTKAWNN
jgi:hypothetical protein